MSKSDSASFSLMCVLCSWNDGGMMTHLRALFILFFFSVGSLIDTVKATCASQSLYCFT